MKTGMEYMKVELPGGRSHDLSLVIWLAYKWKMATSVMDTVHRCMQRTLAGLSWVDPMQLSTSSHN